MENPTSQPKSRGGRGGRGRGRGRTRSQSSSSSSSSSSRSRSRSPIRRRQPRRRALVQRGDPPPAVNRADQALIRVQGRQDTIDNTIDALEPDRAKAILKQVAAREPALLLDLLAPAEPVNQATTHDATTRGDQPEGEPEGEPEGGDPPAVPAAPNWCVCGNCREMPTATERVCCGYRPENCVKTLADFHVVCLDEGVLAVAQLYRRDFLAVREDIPFNDRNRHAAYRQFVLWQHGRLGGGNRRVIPSCAVWAIRDKYPQAQGQYTGFLANRLG